MMPMSAPPAALKLRRLTWDRFGSLTEAEWELFQAVVSGDALDLTRTRRHDHPRAFLS